MACQCNWENKDCKKIMKILNIIAGLSIIACGILRLIFLSQYSSSNKFLYSALSAYLVIFGLIIGSSELEFEKVTSFFSFQSGYVGRGIFLIFVGIICLDPFKIDTFIGFFNIIIGAYGITMGVLSIIFGCFDQKKSSGDSNNSVKNVAPPQINRV